RFGLPGGTERDAGAGSSAPSTGDRLPDRRRSGRARLRRPPRRPPLRPAGQGARVRECAPTGIARLRLALLRGRSEDEDAFAELDPVVDLRLVGDEGADAAVAGGVVGHRFVAMDGVA